MVGSECPHHYAIPAPLPGITKAKIDKQAVSSKCRLCNREEEPVNHIVFKYQILAQREYKCRRDGVGKAVHWCLCRKYSLQCDDKWYEHVPGKGEESEAIKILRYFRIQQTDHQIEYNKPNPLVVDKHQAACHIIDKAIQGDVRVEVKEKEKIDKFQDQAKDVRKLWSGLELLWRRLGQFQKDRWAILKVLG